MNTSDFVTVADVFQDLSELGDFEDSLGSIGDCLQSENLDYILRVSPHLDTLYAAVKDFKNNSVLDGAQIKAVVAFNREARKMNDDI